MLVVAAACLICCGCGAKKPQLQHAIALTPSAPAPSFLLRDQAGAPTGPQRYRGHWTVVTFLYTQCPDVCPLIANQLIAAQRQDSDLRVVAVSVDPTGDTRRAVRTFLAAHHAGDRFRYVTGTRKTLAPVWRKYHIASLPGPRGTVSHSAVSILIDPKGDERFLLDSRLTARDVVAAMS
jgi:protein SCO1/2